jgi:serine/threonine protein kinase
MQSKLVLHRDYRFCSGFIYWIPDVFHNRGVTLFKQRNEIKLLKHEDLEFVVKSFKKPHLINQFIYTTFRASKAKRAYWHAIYLQALDIPTPPPVAYFEIKKFGLLKKSYFISAKSRFNREIRELSVSPDLSEAFQILKDFARFTAEVHEKGVFHKDYTPGNILFGKVGDHYEFELVDLNRMKFCNVKLKAGCKNLRRLCFNEEQYRFFVSEYVTARKDLFSAEVGRDLTP